jgi:hypothetical protein
VFSSSWGAGFGLLSRGAGLGRCEVGSVPQHRVDDSENATNGRSESRAREDRAKEIAKREERRKTEQMKADTQRKAESTRAEERRIAESRQQEEKKRADRRQESLRKEAERRTQVGKAAVEKERARRQFNRQAEDGNKAEPVAAEQDKRHALVPALLHVGEFSIAEEDEELLRHLTLADIREANTRPSKATPVGPESWQARLASDAVKYIRS